MSDIKNAVRVYSDIEKLYRLLALYQGKREPLEKHLAIIRSRLDQNLRIESSGIQFDFLMTGVFSGGEEVFRSDQLETTLAYSLFCEGVKALVLSSDLTEKEILEWCILIRSHIESSQNHREEDLASVLWKTPLPNVRVYLYNALLSTSLDGVLTDEENKNEWNEGYNFGDVKDEFGELATDATKAALRDNNENKPSWYKRDEEWEIPSGNLILREVGMAEDLDMDKIKRLKEELADASVSDRARRLIRFDENELSNLRQEMETYDQNHVEFNLVAKDFLVLLQSQQAEASDSLLALKSLTTLVDSVVSRFHAGLIVFIMKRLAELKTKEHAKDWHQQIETRIAEALTNTKNQKIVAEAFSMPARRTIAGQLLSFIKRDQRAVIFDFLQAAGESDENAHGLQYFLEILVKKDPDIEQIFFQWGEGRLLELIPALKFLPWDKKDHFYARCLSHRSVRVAEAVASQVGELNLSARDAWPLFARLSLVGKKTWIESLMKSSKPDVWRPFVREAIRSGKWIEDSYEYMLAWAKLGFQMLGPESLTLFEPIVSSRRLILWPKFPQERLAVLNAALQLVGPVWNEPIRNWASRESGVIFQDSGLKERLRRRG